MELGLIKLNLQLIRINHTYLSKNLTFNRDYDKSLIGCMRIVKSSKKINGLNSHHYHVNISKLTLQTQE